MSKTAKIEFTQNDIEFILALCDVGCRQGIELARPSVMLDAKIRQAIQQGNQNGNNQPDVPAVQEQPAPVDLPSSNSSQ